MRVVIEAGAADEVDLLARTIRETFPDISIVEDRTRAGAGSRDANNAAPPDAGISRSRDEDVRAIALFPIENPSPVLRFAGNGKLLFANRASKALLASWGLSENSALPEGLHCIIEDALSTGRPIQRVMPSGDRVFSLDFVPVVDAGYVNIYGRDVTVQRAEREVLKTIMEHTQAQLAYLDPQFNFVTVNSAYATGSGHGKEELVGHNHFDLFPNAENQAIFERARDNREVIEYRAKPFVFADQPERGTTYWDWTLTPVADGDGPVKGLVLSLVDVTQRVQAERLSQALNSIHTALSSKTDVAEIMDILLTLSMQALGCDAGGIGMREGDRWVLRHGVGLPARAFGTAMADADAPVSALVAARRQPLAITDNQAVTSLNLHMMASYGIRAVLALPLIVRDRVIGVLSFNYYHPRSGFSEAEMDFARRLAVSASLALENARLLASEFRQREAAERRAAEMETTLDAITDGVMIYDAEGNVIRHNPAALAILGGGPEIARIPVDERITRLHAVVADNPEAGPEKMPVARALRGETVRQVLMRFAHTNHPGDAARYILVSASPLYDATEQLLGVVSSFSDVTELRRARDELEQRVQERTERLAILHEIDRSILAARAPAEIAQAAIGKMQQVTAAKRVTVVLCDFTAQIAEIVAEVGVSAEGYRSGARVALALYPMIDVVRAGKVATIGDFAELPGSWPAKEATLQAGNRSATLVPLQTGGQVTGLLSISRAEPGALDSEALALALHVADSLSVALSNARLAQQVQAGRTQLQALSHRLVEVQERERRFVADYLYNQTGQVLAATKLNLGTLRQALRGAPDATRCLNETQDLLDGAMHELHNLASGLRPATLDRLGLVAALQQYVTEFSKTHNLAVEMAADDLNRLGIPAELETALYRIAQEALANVAEHAKATRAEVIISHREHGLTLVVQDDGRGFDLQAVDMQTSLGLVEMRERAESVGGDLTIETQEGGGTAILVETPL
jgi:PAS domain S-box-containing protein